MKTIAIIVGVSNYKDAGFETIPGAKADASRFAAALLSWGFPKEWTRIILQEEATKANLIKTVYDCRSEFDSDTKLIFYFAGHGIRENDSDRSSLESALVMYDTKSDDALSTGLRLVELMQLIRSLKPLQTFLFVDACSLRLNQIDNPLNDGDIFSTTNSKGLFCLLSSGINPSYEDVKHKSGYFTTALLKAISELRLNPQANCHEILKRVQKSLNEQFLPSPESYQIGSEKMWPLELKYVKEKSAVGSDSSVLILRWEALAKLQDYLVTVPDPVIWMWGEGGLGKSVIAEQLAKRNTRVIYASIPSPSGAFANVLQSIIEQIRNQRSELYFNRPPENALYITLNHAAAHQPDCILILDHMDRLDPNHLDEISVDIDRTSIPVILISRFPCPKKLFKRRASSVLTWRAAALNLEETEQIAADAGVDPSLSSVLLNATDGNALKIRHMLVKLSGQNVLSKGRFAKDYIKCMVAVAVCGGFLDQQLFCKIFNIKPHILTSLEKLGLIRYTKEGCFPHDILMEMVEENQWLLDINEACKYWNYQIDHTPYNRWACRSFVLLAMQIEDCSRYKKALGSCLDTLNKREYLTFLTDLVTIFKKHHWEDLLLKASECLIDHEEYRLAGDVLQSLIGSTKRIVKFYAAKINVRRLVWLGQFRESLRVKDEILSRCRSMQIVYPLRNSLGLAHFLSGNLETAMELFLENINYKGPKEERELGIAKYMAGNIMTYRGENISKAKKLLESSLFIFESANYYHWNIVALNGLADLSYSLKQWRQALYYLNKSIEITDALQNKTFYLFTLKNIARVHLRLFGCNSQELTQTLIEMEDILEEVLEAGHNWITMWVINVLATVYAHRGLTHKLKTLMDEVTPLTTGYKECHIFTLSNLGHLAALMKDYAQAKDYYQQAYRLAKELNNLFAIEEIKQDFLGCSLPLKLQDFSNYQTFVNADIRPTQREHDKFAHVGM